MSAIRKLQELGQSMWLDALEPSLRLSETLRLLIDEEGICGALCGNVLSDATVPARDASERSASFLSIKDVQDAADLLRSAYALTAGRDGYVCVPVPADCLRYSRHAYFKARDLWRLIERPNLLVAIPGTRGNLPVIRDLIAAGVNINVTTLYGSLDYRDAFEAYCSALYERLAKGRAISHIALVASFDVPAIDRRIDCALRSKLAACTAGTGPIEELIGKGGIAHASVIHHRARMYARAERFTTLIAQGARLPRLLWRLSSNEDPCYPIGKYLFSLARPGMMCSIPNSAIESYRYSAVLAAQPAAIPAEERFLDAINVLVALRKVGVDVEMLAHKLQLEQAVVHRQHVEPAVERSSEEAVDAAMLSQHP